MPQNNPYDKVISGKRKIISNIGFALTVILVAVFIIWVIVSQPSNIRTEFDHVEFDITLAEGGENEFYSLGRLLESPQSVSPGFAEEFPTAFALLRMESPTFTEGKPYAFSGGGYAGLSLCYNSTTIKNAVTMDVLLIPYSGEAGSVTFRAPVRYTVNYDTSTGIIAKTDVRKESFRLSFYNLAAEFDTKSDVGFRFEFDSVISDREARSTGLLSCVSVGNETVAAALTRTEDGSTLSGTVNGRDDVKVSVQFEDILYDYMTSLTFESEGGFENIRLSLN